MIVMASFAPIGRHLWYWYHLQAVTFCWRSFIGCCFALLTSTSFFLVLPNNVLLRVSWRVLVVTCSRFCDGGSSDYMIASSRKKRSRSRERRSSRRSRSRERGSGSDRHERRSHRDRDRDRCVCVFLIFPHSPRTCFFFFFLNIFDVAKYFIYCYVDMICIVGFVRTL